jgi:hypothetical protein
MVSCSGDAVVVRWEHRIHSVRLDSPLGRAIDALAAPGPICSAPELLRTLFLISIDDLADLQKRAAFMGRREHRAFFQKEKFGTVDTVPASTMALLIEVSWAFWVAMVREPGRCGAAPCRRVPDWERVVLVCDSSIPHAVRMCDLMPVDRRIELLGALSDATSARAHVSIVSDLYEEQLRTIQSAWRSRELGTRSR